MSSNTTQTRRPRTASARASSSLPLMMVLFLGAIYSLSFLTLDNPWPMAVCLVLFALAFWIPQTLLGRSDSAGEN